jgi:predicted ATPase/class 3 adenylate cyclase
MAARSAGTVTFLLTDIEHSTRLLSQVGLRYPELVAEHRAIITDATERHGGIAVPTEGDACMAIFPTPDDAVEAAIEAQRRLLAHDWTDAPVHVRIGVHTGQAMLHDGEYFGLDLHRAARIANAGHGGQVLVSQTTQALVAGDLPPDVHLLDLGAHRLRDLEAPVRLYQVEADGLGQQFPPLRTLRGTAHNLPVQATSFVGRATQVSEVTDLLEHLRLVTLTGPGGVGKTRLALQVGANAVHAFPDGVWWIELTEARGSSAVTRLIAESLGLDVSDAADPAAVIADALRDHTALLILDNFEHVIDSAPVVSTILAAAAQVRVLVTSRERLLITGEQVCPVPPLDLGVGAVDSRRASDGVALFVQRARSHDPAFVPERRDLETIAAICELVDGLPLAIELAAAQTRLLPVAAIHERLTTGMDALSGGARDQPVRHRTLRETIAWSYRLLSRSEQRLFARLSVFRGGRSLEAITAVCMDGLDLDPVAAMAALVDKSMVQRRIGEDGDVIFTLLELLHEFAGEALDDGDRTHRRHAEHFAALAERADEGMLTHEAHVWEALLNRELGNLRAALEWAFSGGEASLGVRIAAALNLFWYWGGPHDDGRRWIQLALGQADEPDDHTRGRLHIAAGFFGFADGDGDTSRRHWQAALAAFRSTGDDARRSWMLSMIAVTYAGDADHYDSALALVDEAVALARSLRGRTRVLADTLTAKGEVARLAGDDDIAGACYREALTIVQPMGNERYVATLQANLAYIAGHAGDYESALRLALEGLEIAWKAGQRVFMAWSLSGLADAECGLGRPERAARLIGAAEAAMHRLGVGRQPTDEVEHDRTMARLTGVVGHERLHDLLVEGAQMSLDEAVDYALEGSDPAPAR